MWLQISFLGKTPLYAAVGQDGKIYFLVRSVAKLLGYAKSHRFSKNRSRLNLENLVPSQFWFRLKMADKSVFDFKNMMEVIADSDRMPVVEVEEMGDLWTEGYVASSRFVDCIPMLPEDAQPVQIDRRGVEPVRDFVSRFVETTLKYFKFHALSKRETRRLVKHSRFREKICAEPEKGIEIFSTRASGVYTQKSTGELGAVLKNAKRKFKELEKDYDSNETFELNITLVRKKE